MTSMCANGGGVILLNTQTYPRRGADLPTGYPQEAVPATVGRKLDADVVSQIRILRAEGELVVDLASRFGVSASLICQVCTGQIWSDAPGPLTRRTRDSRRPAVDRFWEQVATAGPDDCWPWTGGLDPGGYGRLYVGGHGVQANRFALELRLDRELTADEVSRHTCDNRPCCNPKHLVPGSIADNNRDTVERGRQAWGERSAKAKLSEADVIEIRRLAGTVPFSVLAVRFGVSDRAVRYAASGERWRHLLPAPLASQGAA